MQERRLGLAPGFFDDVPARAAMLSLDRINAFIAGHYAPEAFVMGRISPEDN
jgi:hypothetical protein